MAQKNKPTKAKPKPTGYKKPESIKLGDHPRLAFSFECAPDIPAAYVADFKGSAVWHYKKLTADSTFGPDNYVEVKNPHHGKKKAGKGIGGDPEKPTVPKPKTQSKK